MNDELLPCPFCGAKAEIERSEQRFEYSENGGPDSVSEYGYYVYCKKCDASIGTINVPPSSHEQATIEWNKRAPIAAPDLLEALCFAKSVIHCGEPWTETCERVIGAAIAKLKGPSGS